MSTLEFREHIREQLHAKALELVADVRSEVLDEEFEEIDETAVLKKHPNLKLHHNDVVNHGLPMAKRVKALNHMDFHLGSVSPKNREGDVHQYTKIHSELTESSIEEGIQLDEARAIKIVNRVRKGKVQRRKKVSGRKGYTIKKGKLKRISPAWSRRMSRIQKKAARKRRPKLKRALRKRRISLRRRKAAGIR